MTTERPPKATKRSRPTSLPVLCQALERSITEATWLTPADAGAVELARLLARHLVTDPNPASSRVYAQLLRDLGLTVAGRKQETRPTEEVSPLDAIQARAALRLADPAPLHPDPRPARKPRRGAQ